MVLEKVGNEMRFKNPGSLLMVVLGFAFWGVGFLDLLGHKSAEPDVFGLYSWPFFLMIILYGLTITIWFKLFFNPDLLIRVTELIKSVQGNKRLAPLVIVGLGIALWLIFEWDRWARLPGLQFSAFGLLILSLSIFLLANWNEGVRQQPWRKIIVYPVVALIVVEVLVQLIAYFGVIPGVERLGGHFYPYERIYYRGDSVQDGFANRYGWYYLDTKLDTKKKHILIVGGSIVQALQVQPTQQFSAVLTSHINEGETEMAGKVDLIPIGLPGFGLSSFLFDDSMSELPRIVNTDEIIVMFHLGDDFQSPVAAHNAISYVLNETNEAEVDAQDARLRHDLTHYYLRGYMSFQIVGTIRSNYLTPKIIAGLLRGSGGETRTGAAPGDGVFDFPRLVGHVSDYYTITKPGNPGIKTTEFDVVLKGNNFMFTQGGNDDMREAVMIADSLLRNAQEIASANGVKLRVVTIPMFPDGFYDSFDGGTWEPQVGGYDLLMPEQALVETAKKYGISILPMGHYMLEDGITVDKIRALYFTNEEAALTPEGHAYFADAMYACFYSNSANSICSK